MNTIYNYEYAAAEVFDTSVEFIFKRTRNNKAPFARHILMYYRMNVLKKTQVEAARRYGFSRSTALFAGRKVEFFLQQYPKIKAKYDEFVVKSDQNFFKSIDAKVAEIGACLKEVVDLTSAEKYNFEAHEKRMLKLAACDKSLAELKTLISNRWKEI